MITVTKTDLPLSVSANMSTVSMPEDLMDIILVSVDLATMLYHTERNTNAVSTEQKAHLVSESNLEREYPSALKGGGADERAVAHTQVAD